MYTTYIHIHVHNIYTYTCTKCLYGFLCDSVEFISIFFCFSFTRSFVKSRSNFNIMFLITDIGNVPSVKKKQQVQKNQKKGSSNIEEGSGEEFESDVHVHEIQSQPKKCV